MVNIYNIAIGTRQEIHEYFNSFPDWCCASLQHEIGRDCLFNTEKCNKIIRDTAIGELGTVALIRAISLPSSADQISEWKVEPYYFQITGDELQQIEDFK